MPSSIDFERISYLATAIAWGKNTHVFFDLKDVDANSPEHKANVQSLLNEQQALFDDGHLIDQVDEVLQGAVLVDD